MEILISTLIDEKTMQYDYSFVNKFNEYFKKSQTLRECVRETIKTHHAMNMEKIQLLLLCKEFDFDYALAWAVTFQKKDLINAFKEKGNILKGCYDQDLNCHIIDFCVEHQINKNKILRALLKDISAESYALSKKIITTVELTDYIEIFKSFKKNNMDINFKDKEGKTIIHYICNRQIDINNIHTLLLFYQAIIDCVFDLNISDPNIRNISEKYPISNKIKNELVPIKNNDIDPQESCGSQKLNLNDLKNNIDYSKNNIIKAVYKNQTIIKQIKLVHKTNVIYQLVNGEWKKSILKLNFKPIIESIENGSNLIFHLHDNNFIRFSRDTLIYKDSDISMLGNIYADSL